MLIDMLIFRAAMKRRSSAQSHLFEARPRDFVRLKVPADGEPTAGKVRDAAGVDQQRRRDEPTPRD